MVQCEVEVQCGVLYGVTMDFLKLKVPFYHVGCRSNPQTEMDVQNGCTWQTQSKSSAIKPPNYL
jgi:hypothetical protein